MIRRAIASDAGPLLRLMRELARFEGYDHRFAVDEDAIIARGLAPAATPEFVAFVADSGGSLLGYAVVIDIPFTFDLRPSLLLKELYVDSGHRGHGVGLALFRQVQAHARLRGCGRIMWTVLPDNLAAQRFYKRAGGAPDHAWQHWQMELLCRGA
jgi:GNAT superfamily N-acetyltransferase